MAEALILDIKAGNWRIGDALPTEAELVQRFGASRSTVRESLRELAAMGYIKRRQGARSILVADDPTDSFVNSVQSIGELLQYSGRTRSTLLARSEVVATGDMARRLGVVAGSRWLRLDYLRTPMRGQLPLGLSEIYVDARHADALGTIDDSLTIYRQLEQRAGLVVRRVEQSIEASTATPAMAAPLRVAPGSPLLLVRTEFITSAGEVMEVGLGHFPAGRYRMEIMLQRSGGASDIDG
ncbi:GntR family transcriptional regulator [Microvirga sp. SRT01]|uniref:GntR family transcriptional regulator n=1 Tax=Sphingomonas longa TaxID=2778730 RepID=A0ABS2DA71_9SPHN|nr:MULTISPECIES: GntR family transcriptional regulator [Alphaproteobacteria]MBM6577825.1 GntR family transcriptional regulator [Sphingomonas sp. BT552]MBR7710867.1 GntR family transcriptional regulator [Microvirga sp. SRT01]